VVLLSHQTHEGIQACQVTLQVANLIIQRPKDRRSRGLTVAQVPAECAECKVVFETTSGVHVPPASVAIARAKRPSTSAAKAVAIRR
jgi:hypothetical protein